MNNTIDKNQISQKDVGHLIYLLEEKDLGEHKVISPKDSAIESMEMVEELGRSVKVSINGWENIYKNNFTKIANAVTEAVHALKYSGELNVSEEFEDDMQNESCIDFWKKGTGYKAIMLSPDAIYISHFTGAHILQEVWNKIQEETITIPLSEYKSLKANQKRSGKYA